MAVAIPEDGLVGLASIERPPPIGSMPNAQHQHSPGFLKGALYELAIVEFDDQGRCYDRGQMDGVAQRLGDLTTQKTDAIIIAFVHGWKHDARTDDENLSAFRGILKQTVEFEKGGNPTPRPVLGVFVGWRGLSRYGLGDAVADVTFWDRQAAGLRVATGSVRELFGRLRNYRTALLDEKGSPLLVIAGHSFGGMIVFSALAQSLIEAASTPAGHVVPSFADLVLLVNPAIEGARYIPIQDLVSSAAVQTQRAAQLPVFVCAQAENDEPVGTWFSVGSSPHKIDEATIGPLEDECVTHALGFVKDFRTHALTGPVPGSDFVLDPPEIAQANPFWVIGASKEVIDGHGGIWQQPFLQFLAGLLFGHVQASTQQKRLAPVLPQDVAENHLAAFTRTFKTMKLN